MPIGRRTEAEAQAFVESVGAAARARRRARGLSQEALGERLGGDHALVSRIESGVRDMRLSQLYLLAAELGLHPKQLVDVARRR